MTEGVCKWFNERRGYGFIQCNNLDGDVFVHYSSIQGKGFKTLVEGETVKLEVEETERGLQARNVTRGQKN